MRRRITRILPPRGPACAPCEPRGRVWRDPAVASAARCSDPTPGALPCPTHPLSCAEHPVVRWVQPRRLRPSAAARRPRRGPQVLRSGLAARAAWLLDAAAAGRQLRMAAARRRSRGCAAVAPRARPRAVRRAAAHAEQPRPGRGRTLCQTPQMRFVEYPKCLLLQSTWGNSQLRLRRDAGIRFSTPAHLFLFCTVQYCPRAY